MDDLKEYINSELSYIRNASESIVRNLLDIDTTETRAQWQNESLIKSKENRPGIETRNALIFFCVVNYLYYCMSPLKIVGIGYE